MAEAPKASSTVEARGDIPLGPPNLDRAAQMFRALGDPTRLAIYEVIRQAEPGPHSDEEVRRTVSEVASYFKLSLSTVSHHIRELRNAGLIRCERRGQTVYCSPAAEAVGEITRYLER